MGGAPTFEKHLVISYAHLDNQPLTPQDAGWVSRFHESLAVDSEGPLPSIMQASSATRSTPSTARALRCSSIRSTAPIWDPNST